jgi:anti-anti-sigma factor
MNNTGDIYYAVSGNRAFLKLTGIIRYPLSHRLNLAVSRIFSRAKVHDVVVDLQDAEFIDSTCLGLLARVATHCLEQSCERPIIFSSQPEITRLLRSMGFDQAFALVDNPSKPVTGLNDASKLAGGRSTRLDPNLILDAHRALCELNQSNETAFHTVLEQLESDAGGPLPIRSPDRPRGSL